MRFETHTVSVTIVEINEVDIYTIWINEIRGAFAQGKSLSEAFTELGTQLKVLKLLEDEKNGEL